MSTKDISTYDVLSDSEDELDWEEVTVPQAQHIELEEDQAGPSTRPNIEVTFEAYPSHREGNTRYEGFSCLADEHFEVALQEKVIRRHPAC
jgi:hypothetical protein